MFYSKSTGGFYTTEIHGENIPSDAKEITSELYIALLDGQTEGKQISSDNDGNPILIVPTDTRTYAQKRAAEYPPVTDYLDGVVKNDQAQISTYIAECLRVKAKYPKS
jgi:hypothetical protein